MRRAMIFSAMLHFSVAVVAVLGLPVLSDREPVVDRPVVVEMVRLAEKTTPPPEREPPKPVPPRRAEPKPEPAEPEAVEIPPPPKAGERPPPPETVLARPAPKPEPKPEPKVKSEPEPKPEPKVTKLVPKPKPKLGAKKLANVKPGRKPLTPREDFAASVLKDLSKEERRSVESEQTEEVEKKIVLAPSPPRPGVDLRMTVSELDAIRRQIEACWSLPAGARDAENLVVDIRVVMNPDGTVRQASVVERNRMATDAFFRAAAESALRAVLNPRCNPLKLPPKKYREWQTFTLSFNPKDMIGS